MVDSSLHSLGSIDYMHYELINSPELIHPGYEFKIPIKRKETKLFAVNSGSIKGAKSETQLEK